MEKEQGIFIDQFPEQKHSLLIAGFEGWGNALDVSRSMVSFIIRKLEAKRFARINPEAFYRYDENRPRVNINFGQLRSLTPPGGGFYSANIGSTEQKMVILKAPEPNLRWEAFVKEVLKLCRKLQVDTLVSVGSMYDDVLHSDQIISGFASTPDLVTRLNEKGVRPITYSGQTSIHSLLHDHCEKTDIRCMSLWCHCPYYLQGTTHFGVLSYLGKLLANLGGFELDVKELEMSWTKVRKQIQALIRENPELQAMVNGLQKARDHDHGVWPNMAPDEKKSKKIIQIKDFLDPK